MSSLGQIRSNFQIIFFASKAQVSGSKVPQGSIFRDFFLLQCIELYVIPFFAICRYKSHKLSATQRLSCLWLLCYSWQTLCCKVVCIYKPCFMLFSRRNRQFMCICRPKKKSEPVQCNLQTIHDTSVKDHEARPYMKSHDGPMCPRIVSRV